MVLQAGAVVTAEPEVRQVTLPVGGGRIVLASDGLWDATNPKTALHHVRAMPASKAATELVRPSQASNARLMPVGDAGFPSCQQGLCCQVKARCADFLSPIVLVFISERCGSLRRTGSAVSEARPC